MHRPVRLRKFDSGVMVIQSKSQSDDEVGLVSLDNFHLRSSCFVGICQMDEHMSDVISWMQSIACFVGWLPNWSFSLENEVATFLGD
jgi:hypothetical protein